MQVCMRPVSFHDGRVANDGNEPAACGQTRCEFELCSILSSCSYMSVLIQHLTSAVSAAALIFELREALALHGNSVLVALAVQP